MDISHILSLLSIYLLYKLVKGLYRNCIRRPHNLLQRYKVDKTPWVCITGATSGIGLGLAFELARLGFNILMVSRSQSKLKNCCNAVKQKYPVETAYVIAEFGKSPSLQFYEKVAQDIKAYDVGLLINNAGVMNPLPYEQKYLSDILSTIQVNLTPYALLTSELLPSLQARPKSGIININSVVGQFTLPGMPIYCATKGFGAVFSRALGYELGNKIDVLSVQCFGVETNLLKMKRNPFFISPEMCAQGLLKHLGYQNQAYGHWNHELQGFLLQIATFLLPNWIWNRIKRLVIRGYYWMFSVKQD